MNTTRSTTGHFVRRAGLAAIAGLALVLPVGLAAPASAEEVIASDSTIAAVPAAVAAVPTAVASRPRTITVTNHRGRSVTLFAKGERIRRVLAPGSRPVTFTGLTPGRTYTVAIGGEPIGAVVALDAPTAASGLTVRTTSTPGTVQLSWRHTPTTGTGGRAIGYDVAATGAGTPALTTRTVGARSATLTGLDPKVLYTFTVTPRNSAGRGKATRAVMTRPLAQISGAAEVPSAPAPTVSAPAPGPVPAPAPTVATAPEPAPAPRPAPAPAPAPATKTIYRCPEGYVTMGELCQQTKAYTYHTQTLTSPYTYSQKFTQTGTDFYFSADCSTGGVYYANGDQGAGCYRWQPTGYYTTVKDAPPAGYTDDGTQYAKDVQVKDDLPEGWTDDGTQWVRTTVKEAIVVSL